MKPQRPRPSRSGVRRPHRRIGALLATVTLAVTTVACGGPASTSDDGTLNAVIGYGNNQSWDPTQTASAFAMAGNNHVYEALVEGDPITRAPEPGLAKALPEDLGGTSLRFQLRDGAMWSDGQPVTADDVVFTYERILDPEDNVLLRSFFTLWLDSVVKVDATTVEFKLKQPFPYALERIETAKIMPKHVFEGHWEDAAGGKTLGSGPYQVSEQAPLDHTTFTKNPHYNGPHPAAYEKMVWKSIVDAAPRVAAISGPNPQATIVENIPPANISQLTEAGRQVESVQGQNNVFLLFNTTKAPFDDKLVRQALHYAIDKQKLVDVALKGQGVAATSYLNPSLPDYQAAGTDYAYDPEKAKALLAQAGVTDLQITLSSTNTSLVVDSLNVVKEGWDAVGVETTLDSQDTKALFSKLDGGADFQVVAASGNPEQFGNDPDLVERYYYNRDSVMVTNYAKWSDAQSDSLYELMDKAAYETDDAARTTQNKEILDIIADQAVLYPVVFTKLSTAWAPDRITGVKAQGYPGINLLRAGPA